MYGDQLVLNCVVLPCTFYYISFICNLFKLWPYNLYIINIKRLLQPPSINQLISRDVFVVIDYTFTRELPFLIVVLFYLTIFTA